jgi:hypothetical protein
MTVLLSSLAHGTRMPTVFQRAKKALRDRVTVASDGMLRPFANQLSWWVATQ